MAMATAACINLNSIGFSSSASTFNDASTCLIFLIILAMPILIVLKLRCNGFTDQQQIVPNVRIDDGANKEHASEEEKQPPVPAHT